MNNVCIVIPTYNREENLKSSLHNNLAISSQMRVFVIDASENPFVANYPNVTVVPAHEKGQSKQKYQGAQLAEAQGYKWILFLDDDIYLEEKFFSALETYLETVPKDFLAASFQIKNHSGAQHLSNILLNFSRKGGALLSSTYTTPLNGSSFKVQWCNGGAVMWKVTAFMKVSRDYDISGKAICEDIYSSSHYGRNGFYLFGNCVVYENDGSSVRPTRTAMYRYAHHEFSARLRLIELRPKIFKKSHFLYHACWRAFIFTILGVVTCSQKRLGYGLGLGYSVIKYSSKLNDAQWEC